ncbi:anthranilate synthase component I [Anaerosinus massiliensis]|uniref:anthranilate synthase component I n=1 Tax=Massilibacillus massiliensis TaxID=1806837 RepID=UPI000A790859|nr:anthranilate synthase component I [Massilibacillus massiliensis]
MHISPSKEVFIEQAAAANMVAVSAEISTDMETPVSLYYKLVGNELGFIFESVDTNKNFGRFSFIGAEPFAQLKLYKDHADLFQGEKKSRLQGTPSETVKSYMEQFKIPDVIASLPLVHGGAIGYFAYESVATFERIRGLDIPEDMVLGEFLLCQTLVVMDHLKHTSKLICLAQITEKDHLALVYQTMIEKLKAVYQKLQQPVAPIAAVTKQQTVQHKKSFEERFGKLSKTYMDKVIAAKKYIVAGDIFQIVPSHKFQCKIKKPAFYFYRRLRQINPSPYMFYINFGKRKLIGSSPEMLVKVSGDTVYTYPIAGTRKRGKDAAEDRMLSKDLLADAKECAEHAMLVDLGRNDIGRVSRPGTVEVTKLMQIEKFSHVMHMVSEVKGTIKQGYTAIDVLKACFPAGTVSGAPKLRAMEIIHELEMTERSTYAGCTGYIDFNGNMDMCITIRTIRLDDDTAFIQAGGGIVADSIPENEYREILQKAQVLFQVIEEVEEDDFIN